MVPEFASNVAHCDNILVSLIRLRPRVKLSTRTTHILCSNRLHLVFKMWHVRTLDALVREYDCEQDTADEVPGLEYSSGEDSDMEDMGEEMGEEMGGAVDMGEKRNFVDVMSRQKPRTDAAGMWQCEVCSHHKRCKACTIFCMWPLRN